MKRKSLSIQQKLMRIILTTSGIVIFLTCVSFVVYQFYTIKESAKTQLSILGEIVASNSTAALAFHDSLDATETLRSLKAQEYIIEACLYDTNRTVFARYPDTISISAFPTEIKSNEYNYGGFHLVGFQDVVQQNMKVGTLYLRADMTEIYYALVQYGVIGFLVFSLGTLVAYILSKRLQRTISDPILSLSMTAESVSLKKNYDIRAIKYDDDELGLLTDAFNNMLETIEKQNASIVQFSHGLEQKVKQRTIELEQANMDLRLQTELSEKIINASVDLIAVFDKDLKFVLVNNWGKLVYQLEDEDFQGKHLLDVFPQIKDEKMFIDLNRALTGEVIHTPYYFSKITKVILETFVIPLRNSVGEVYSVLLVGHNITEIIESSRKLKELNLVLEQSNRDLEQFAYIASHDLQEPLRKIQMFSELLIKSMGDSEKMYHNISKISSSALRMSDLINGILEYSRLENGKFKAVPVSLDLILENIFADFDMTIREKSATITKNQMPYVSGNQFQLNQLFSNLLSNALKFSTEIPSIHISSLQNPDLTKLAFEGSNPDSSYCLIEFSDNGIGFSEKYYQKVFTVFQRLHTKDQYPGSGIGLALCKKIVDNHNGHISVKSEVGKGTIFSIVLPICSNHNELYSQTSIHDEA